MKLAATATLTLCLSLLFVLSKASMLKGSDKVVEQEERQLSKRRVKKPDYRNCDFDESDDEVTFTCKATNAPDVDDSSSEDEEGAVETQPESRGIILEPAIEIRDEIKYKVETDKEGVQIKIEYEQEYEEADGIEEEISGESKTKFEIVFESIIEYVPSDAKEQAYNWNVDNIVQTLPLEDWNPLSTVTNDGGVVSHFFASSEDLVAAFNFTISRANEGDKLTANTMKIDVHITNFPWQRNDTFLALMSTVKSELDVDVKHDDEASVLLAQDNIQVPFSGAIDTIGFVPFGSYSWENMAEAIETDSASTGGDVVFAEPVSVERAAETDTKNATEVHSSQTIQVVATSPADFSNETSTSMEISEKIAYSFVGSEAAHNASHIYWDPEAGVGYEESDSNEYVIVGGNGGPMQMVASSATVLLGKFGCLPPVGLLLDLGILAFLVVG